MTPPPPVRLRTLGAADLRAPDGRELGAILRQPKRLCLLAYLAAAPRRFHRRDSLLGLFWPELDETHARAALRRALYFLRSELGPDVLAGRGHEEVGVAEETLWCDAGALERALAAGDPGRAAELYRGDFLEGLHVAGASSELQEWLDRERERLRGRAAAAARALAERAETAGRTADALRWTRRLLELAPDDEAALRRHLLLLERRGDRAGAIRAYDEFARRLAQDLDLTPSAEARALVAELRAREEAAEPPADPERIAVLPFAVRGDHRLAYLGEGMVELLAAKLDGAGEVRTVDARSLLLYLAREGRRWTGDPAQARAVARHFGAARCLLGTLVEAGGRLELSASLYDLQGGRIASATASGQGEPRLFELVDDLARGLLAAAGAGATRLTRLAALTTGSLEALRAHLLGERELRAGRYFDAMDAFQAAVDADAGFGLAHYRLAAAAAGCALPDVARSWSDRAAAHQDGLPPHDRLVFRAQRAWLHGEVAEAESHYAGITHTWPDDLEAWFHLGDLLFHSNPLRGRSAAEAREPFERVLRLEPEHVGALAHLARIAGMTGRRDDMLALAGRVLAASPAGDQALAMRALRVFAGDDRDAMAALAAELREARALTMAIAFSDVALYSGNPAGAELLARCFLPAARTPELRALCHILLAHLALARGREDDARAELTEAQALDHAWGLELRGYFAALPFGSTPEDEVRRVRAELAGWSAEVPASGFLPFAMHDGLHPAIRLWLLGLLDLRLGEAAAALGRAEELARLEGDDAGLVRGMEGELRAGAARLRGRTDEALALLDATRPRPWFQLTVASPFFTLASRRWLQAELLDEGGRGQEAAGWFASMAERSPYEMIYAGRARERLGDLTGVNGKR